MSVNTNWQCGAPVRLERCSLVRFLCNHAWAVSETTVPQTRKVAATCKNVAGHDCSPLVSRHVSDVVLYETMVPGVTTPLKNLIKAVGGCQRGGVRRSLAAGRLFS